MAHQRCKWAQLLRSTSTLVHQSDSLSCRLIQHTRLYIHTLTLPTLRTDLSLVVCNSFVVVPPFNVFVLAFCVYRVCNHYLPISLLSMWTHFSPQVCYRRYYVSLCVSVKFGQFALNAILYNKVHTQYATFNPKHNHKKTQKYTCNFQLLLKTNTDTIKLSKYKSIKSAITLNTYTN